jgi:hypothetical protein
MTYPDSHGTAATHGEVPRSFAEVFGNCTKDEKIALVWRLAEIRYRNTIQTLMPRGAFKREPRK